MGVIIVAPAMFAIDCDILDNASKVCSSSHKFI